MKLTCTSFLFCGVDTNFELGLIWCVYHVYHPTIATIANPNIPNEVETVFFMSPFPP